MDDDIIRGEETNAATARPSAAGSADDTCVLMNARSGKRRGQEQVRELEALLADLSGRYELRLLEKGGDLGDAVDRALADGFGTIVAAGGDGTVCAVASRLVGTDRRMGVLPLGTFNYFARSLGMPEALDEAVRVLHGGRPVPIHVGEVNGRMFLNNASLGLYPAILQRREEVYSRWGRSRLAAYWSVMQSLVRFRSPLKLKVTLDGEVRRLSTPLVFVAKNAYQLELFGLEGADCVRSGRFAVMVAPDRGRLELALYAVRLALGTMTPDRDFELLCGSDILVEDRRRSRSIARDGEHERLSAPFRFRMHRDALRVLVPAEAA